MIKLYGFGQSRSFRALWALEESGLAYEYVPVTLRTDGAEVDSAQHPNYLSLNVQGKVPSLEINGQIITESVAILNYIGREAPKSGLLPEMDTLSLARYDELAAFILAELEQPLWSKGKHVFALPEEQRIPQMLETAKFEFAKAVSALDHLLGDDDFAINNSFTLIDILLAQTFNWAIRFEYDVPEKYVRLKERHYARPAAKRAFAIVE